MAGKTPRTVDEYLAGVPAAARAALGKLRGAIAAAAPGSTEVIRYRMPVVRHEGRQLVGFAAFRDHCSFFVMSPAVIRGHARALKGYDLAAGTVRFRAEDPLPMGLVKRLVRARIVENRALTAKRKVTARGRGPRRSGRAAR